MTDQLVSCEICGHPDRWRERYCAHCGHDLARGCTGCGVANHPTNRFCIGCGDSFTAAGVDELEVVFPPAPQPLPDSGRYSMVRGRPRSPDM